MADLLAYKGALVGIWLAGLFLAERFWPAAPLPAAVARAPLARLARNLALAAINFLLSPGDLAPHRARRRPCAPLASGLVARLAGPGAGSPAARFPDLLVAPGQSPMAPPLALPSRPSPRPDPGFDLGAALPFRGGADLGRRPGRRHPAAGLSLPLGCGLRDPAADRHHLRPARTSACRPGWRGRWRCSSSRPRSIGTIIHRRRIDTDSNYGTVFSFWDRLFASRSRARRSPEMEIGVEGAEELDLPRPPACGRSKAEGAIRMS